MSDPNNQDFFNCGPRISDKRSAFAAKAGDLAIVRCSYIAMCRGQVVRLLERQGPDWKCAYVNRVEGQWIGPDGSKHWYNNQTPIFNYSSLEIISESSYAKFKDMLARLTDKINIENLDESNVVHGD